MYTASVRRSPWGHLKVDVAYNNNLCWRDGMYHQTVGGAVQPGHWVPASVLVTVHVPITFLPSSRWKRSFLQKQALHPHVQGCVFSGCAGSSEGAPAQLRDGRPGTHLSARCPGTSRTAKSCWGRTGWVKGGRTWQAWDPPPKHVLEVLDLRKSQGHIVESR